MAAGASRKRTIHLSFLPDEEIGGADGMNQFLEVGYTGLAKIAGFGTLGPVV